MNASEILTSETGLTLAASLFTAAWTFFKGQEWFRNNKNERVRKALDALEAGVEKTYDSYVLALKEANLDGKLTAAERKRARELAREAAIMFGTTQGIDVARELGREYLDLWIERLVRKTKPAS
ncbi:MAG: hypothetical protein WC655_08690 [Candidatus Hydrogenedentales bacterium]|jgi:hypothetical protein